mmetsp:Transcript_32176/g.87211  ORF Transcript_32176/g.87211 Transcript_32176/m.87211 type:complete len:296 (+) Transcript_32176:42-929(+)
MCALSLSAQPAARVSEKLPTRRHVQRGIGNSKGTQKAGTARHHTAWHDMACGRKHGHAKLSARTHGCVAPGDEVTEACPRFAPWLHACPSRHNSLQLPEEVHPVQNWVHVACHDAVVCLEGRPVVPQVCLPRKQQALLLQPIHDRVALRAQGVAPLVEFLAERDAGARNEAPEQDVGLADKGHKGGEEGHGGDARRVAVVAEVSVGDGPRLLMVALERLDLPTEDRRGGTAVVVHGPVVDSGTKVSKLCGQDGHQDARRKYRRGRHASSGEQRGHARQTHGEQHKCPGHHGALPR